MVSWLHALSQVSKTLAGLLWTHSYCVKDYFLAGRGSLWPIVLPLWWSLSLRWSATAPDGRSASSPAAGPPPNTAAPSPYTPPRHSGHRDTQYALQEKCRATISFSLTTIWIYRRLKLFSQQHSCFLWYRSLTRLWWYGEATTECHVLRKLVTVWQHNDCFPAKWGNSSISSHLIWIFFFFFF